MIEAILAGLLLGLGGSLHCVGMCGPIVTAFSLSTKQQSFSRTLVTTTTYNMGRMSTYLLLGIAVGLIGNVSDNLMFLKILRIIAAAALIGAGLAMLLQRQLFRSLEFLGRGIWQRIQPITKRLNPSRSLVQAYASGILWGLLPCGLVYTAITIALGQGELSLSALFMLSFGLGTFFPMLLMGIGFSQLNKWLKTRVARTLIAISMIALGSLALWPMISGSHQHASPSETDAPSSMHEHHHHSLVRSTGSTQFIAARNA